MGIQVALNKSTNDTYKPLGGGITRVNEGRFVVQQVQSKLKTILGEWLLDSRIGWVNATDFDRNFSIGQLEDRARVIILTTQGVNRILRLSSIYSNRKLEISFSAQTDYGVIDVTIPWDNTGN